MENGAGGRDFMDEDVQGFEDELVSRSRNGKIQTSKVRTKYGDVKVLEGKFGSIRRTIEKDMPDDMSRKEWKVGVITSILPSAVAGTSLPLQGSRYHSSSESISLGGPYVEITYDDGSTSLNVPHREIRRMVEANKRLHNAMHC
jgi:hypothetical protein